MPIRGPDALSRSGGSTLILPPRLLVSPVNGGIGSSGGDTGATIPPLRRVSPITAGGGGAGEGDETRGVGGVRAVSNLTVSTCTLSAGLSIALTVSRARAESETDAFFSVQATTASRITPEAIRCDAESIIASARAKFCPIS